MGVRVLLILFWLLATQSALACSTGNCHSECCIDDFCGTVKLDCSAQMSCHLPSAQELIEVAPPPEGPRFVILTSDTPVPRPVVKTFYFPTLLPQPHEAVPVPPPVPPPRW